MLSKAGAGASPHERRPLRASELPNHVEEGSTVIQRKVAEIVREAPEIVTSTDLEVVADMPVEGSESAIVHRLNLRKIEGPSLEHRIPVFHDMEIGSQDTQMG